MSCRLSGNFLDVRLSIKRESRPYEKVAFVGKLFNSRLTIWKYWKYSEIKLPLFLLLVDRSRYTKLFNLIIKCMKIFSKKSFHKNVPKIRQLVAYYHFKRYVYSTTLFRNVADINQNFFLLILSLPLVGIPYLGKTFSLVWKKQL